MPIFDEYVRELNRMFRAPSHVRYRESLLRAPEYYYYRQPPLPPIKQRIVSYDPLRALPVIVIGRDPPFIGHYLGHVPEKIGDRWYWRIFVGYYEIWGMVLDQRGQPMGYYPFIVNGLPSIGAFMALQHAEQIGGTVRLFQVGILEPIDQVLVPEDSILFLDKVFEGKFRMLIVDTVGVTRPAPYDVVTELNIMHDLLARYAENVHKLDHELRYLQTMYTLKDIEVNKYRTLVEELMSQLQTMTGTAMRLYSEIENLKTQLQYWEQTGIVRADAVRSAVQAVSRMYTMVRQLADALTFVTQMMSQRLGTVLAEVYRHATAHTAPPEAKAMEKKAEEHAGERGAGRIAGGGYA